MSQQLSGHLSIFAMQSMRSIDSWMSTIQANLNGSTRNAFKSTDIFYGGGAVNVFKDPTQTEAGIQIGEQSLSVGHTQINWKQGETVTSTQEQHFAIVGEGFFAVTEQSALSAGAVVSANGTGIGATKAYLIRDGEFHWATVSSLPAPYNSEPVLVTKEGFIVLADATNAAGTTCDNVYEPIRRSSFDDPLLKERPSIVAPSYDAAGTATAPTTLVPYDELKYSRFGSTIYEAPTATAFSTIVNGSLDLLDRRTVTSGSSNSILQKSYLEASNTNINKNITELATLGKIYQGFIQVIKVYNNTLDDVLTFVK